MSCLICADAAESIEAGEALFERKCAQCGHYRIPIHLVLELMEQGQIFNVPSMRGWLAERRQTDAIPVIEAHHAQLVSWA